MADTREIWVDIKNYEGKYKISNLGRVKSLERQVSHDTTRTYHVSLVWDDFAL